MRSGGIDVKFRGYSGIKMAFFFAVALAAFVLALPVKSSAADKCGVVEKLTSPAMAQRENAEIEIQEGDAVYVGDVIKIGQTGYAEIKLIDDTLIAAGANSIVALTEVRFSVGKSQLHVSIDRGAVWISIGSIGLVDAEAVKFTTPNAVVSSGNATLQFTVGSDIEEVTLQWIPNGGKASIYNIKSKKRAELRQTDITLSISKMEIKSSDVTPEKSSE
jgi:hypothetical protein